MTGARSYGTSRDCADDRHDTCPGCPGCSCHHLPMAANFRETVRRECERAAAERARRFGAGVDA